MKIILILFMSSLFMTSLSAQITPQKANQKMKKQGFVVIKHNFKTVEFIQAVKGFKLIDGKLIAGEGFRVIRGKDKDVLINGVRCVTIEQLGGGSLTYSCDCEGGNGGCDVDSNPSYHCEGPDCCNLVTVTVSKDGGVNVEH